MGECLVRAGSPIGGQNALVTVMKFTVRLNPTFSLLTLDFSRFFCGFSSKTTFAGNETQQETLLPSQVHRGSFRDRKLTPPPLKTDSVEMENVMVSLLQGDQKYNFMFCTVL